MIVGGRLPTNPNKHYFLGYVRFHPTPLLPPGCNRTVGIWLMPALQHTFHNVEMLMIDLKFTGLEVAEWS